MPNIKCLGLLVSEKNILLKVFPYTSLCKTPDPWRGVILDPKGLQGYYLNNLGRGSFDELTYQISKVWTFKFQIKGFLKFSLYKSENKLSLGWRHF